MSKPRESRPRKFGEEKREEKREREKRKRALGASSARRGATVYVFLAAKQWKSILHVS